MIRKIINFFKLKSLKHRYRLRKYPNYRQKYATEQDLWRLQSMPRFQKGSTNLLGRTWNFVDSASFLFIYDELFNKEIYKFKTNTPTPYIIDAGANIGLSILYFKKLYPQCKITAFEPDNKVFDVLQANIASFELQDITVYAKALWNETTTLQFYAEGADGGRIATPDDATQIVTIPTCRLRDFLHQKIDLLKIDIEGAETTVLEDCTDLLHNVENLFVEYHSFVGQPQSLHRLLSVLKEAGFRYQIQHIGVFSPHPFIRISQYSQMDLQLNIFAYRHEDIS
jgi:FkbM family methyltransferase